MLALILSVPLMPLVGALVAGLLGSRIGRRGAHRVAIAAVGWSFIASCLIATWVIGDGEVINFNWYVWARIGDATLSIGFLLDSLSVLMMLVVSFVSLMVHIYTIGYMAHDPGYCRFFSYISLFTFSMLMLVMANNFLQLFFGWEAVGLVSYLLIGFWFKRPTATYANLKAFLVNRVGDLGFLLGIGLVFAVFGTLDYAQVFADAPAATNTVLTIPPRRLGFNDGDMSVVVCRGDGQVSAISAACVVARFNGRTYSHFGVNSRGDNGYRRYFYGGANVAVI